MKLVNINKHIVKRIIFSITLTLMFLSHENTNAQALTLEQCIDTALLYNRNMMVSAQDVAAAREKNLEVKSNLIPKLNGSADYRYYTNQPYQLMPAEDLGGPAGTYKEIQFGTPHTLNTNLQLSLPIYHPAIFSSLESTETAYELAEIQREKTTEDVIIEVTTVYYNAQVLLHQLVLLDSNIANTKSLVAATRLLHQQQMAKATDVDRLVLNLQQLQLQRSKAASQYLQVVNILKFHLGKPVSDSLEVLISELNSETSEFQIHETTDLKLLNKKYELTVAEMKGVKNSRLPSLTAYGVYGASGFGNSGDNGFFNLYPVSYFGINLSIPIFNGTATRHKINQIEIEQKKVDLQQDILGERTNLDRINAATQYHLAKENLVLAEDQMSLARQIYYNTVLQNQQGLATISDVLLADNALQEAQHKFLITLVDLRRSELEYMHVTGNILTYNK